MLCQPCQSIFRGTFPIPVWERHLSEHRGLYTSTHTLQQSAIQGCRICRMLRNTLPDHVPRELAETGFHILPVSAVDGDNLEFQLQLDVANVYTGRNPSAKFPLGKFARGL